MYRLATTAWGHAWKKKKRKLDIKKLNKTE